MNALILNRRIDGSLVITDTYGRSSPLRNAGNEIIRDDRGFPETHWFRYDWLLGTPEATVDGDMIRLEFANGSAVYHVDETFGQGYNVTLVSSKLRDPDPIDPQKAEENRAAKERRAADGSLDQSGASPGQAIVDEGGGS